MRKMTKKQTTELVASLELQLANTCQRIYELAVGNRRLIPAYPYVLTRVLPKEHKTEGGIWLAENQQNKPIYEGIVLSVWPPFEKVIRTKENKENGVYKDAVIIQRSSLAVGDRITFPHYEGVSLGDYLDNRYYRLVREKIDQANMPHMGVLGTLDYKGDSDIARQLRELTAKLGSITESGVSQSRGATP